MSLQRRARFSACVALCLTVLAGCASIVSNPAAQRGQRGLVYYMPLNPIVLTLTVDDKLQRTVDVSVLSAVADTKAPNFYLRHALSQAASQSSDITINTGGLLSGESKGSTTSSATSIAQALGKAAGMAKGFGHDASVAQKNLCNAPGTYTWRLYPDMDYGFQDCLLDVQARLIGSAVQVNDQPSCQTEGTEKTCPDHYEERSTRIFGVYYRQRLPVEVVVRSGIEIPPPAGSKAGTEPTYATASRYFVVSAATKHSPISFLPIPRSVFANTTWALTFDAGTPTLYKVTSAGEVAGVLTFPAEIISAYSSAITAGFTSSQAEDKARADALAQMQALAVAQAQAAQCRAVASSTTDVAKIREACAPQQ